MNLFLFDFQDDFEGVCEDFILAPLGIDGLDLVHVLGNHRPRLVLKGSQPLLDRTLIVVKRGRFRRL